MKILFLTQFCTPEPIFKSVPFARELVQRGHEVRILTGLPNYPGGKVYAGYKARIYSREVIDGVPVLRAPLYPSHDASTFSRMANYASFAASASAPLLFGWRPDVVYVYNLVTLGAVAGAIGWLRRIPFVLDVQDIWPDSILESGMGRRWMYSAVHQLCAFAYRRAARITVLSDGFKRLLISRGVPEQKVRVIYNWCDESSQDGSPMAASDVQFDGMFNILFAGNLGSVQGLDTVVKAAAILKEEKSKVRFVFMGKGVMLEPLREMAARLAPENTLFLAARPMREANEVLRKADALLIHLEDRALFDVTIPSKTQAYLAIGKPIIIGGRGDAPSLVRRAGAGTVCSPGNPEELARAATSLVACSCEELAAMGRRGRRFYVENLSMSVGVAAFEEVFAEAAGTIAETPHHSQTGSNRTASWSKSKCKI